MPKEGRVIWTDGGFNELVEAINATPFSEELKDLLWQELMAASRFPTGAEGIVYTAPPPTSGALDLRIPVKLGRKGVALVRALRGIAGCASDEVDDGFHGAAPSGVGHEMIEAGVSAYERYFMEVEAGRPGALREMIPAIYSAMTNARPSR